MKQKYWIFSWVFLTKNLRVTCELRVYRNKLMKCRALTRGIKSNTCSLIVNVKRFYHGQLKIDIFWSWGYSQIDADTEKPSTVLSIHTFHATKTGWSGTCNCSKIAIICQLMKKSFNYAFLPQKPSYQDM